MLSQYKIKILSSILIFCAAIGYFSFRNIAAWLDQSTTPVYSDVIICLSYDSMRIDKAVSLLKKGYGEKIIATTKISYTHLLKEHIKPEQIVMPPSSGTNTYEEGLVLKEYLKQQPAKRITVVSNPYHLYRVRWTFTHLFKTTDYQFTYVSSIPREALGFWWDNSRSRKAVLRELPSIIYYWVGHGLLGLQKDPAWIANIKSHYLDLLNKSV